MRSGKLKFYKSQTEPELIVKSLDCLLQGRISIKTLLSSGGTLKVWRAGSQGELSRDQEARISGETL